MQGAVVFRSARREDLRAILDLIADDVLGQTREGRDEAESVVYEAAFDAIAADGNQMMAVAEREGAVIGYMQISFIPGLSRRGAWRGQFEAVRVASALRGTGIGTAFFDWALAQCRARGCTLVQLTTDVSRRDALRFYQRLGFVASHHGLKRAL